MDKLFEDSIAAECANANWHCDATPEDVQEKLKLLSKKRKNQEEQDRD